MDTKLTVAMVAASASLLVAAISLIAAIITSRRTAQTASSIELLKESIAKASKTGDFADAVLTASLDSLKQSVLAIQNVKDEIQLILHAVDDSLSAKEASSRLLKARDAAMAAFQMSNPHLNDVELHVFHEAKNIVVSDVSVIHAEIRRHKYASELSAPARHKLATLRDRLSELQNVLRDSRADRILDRTLSKN